MDSSIINIYVLSFQRLTNIFFCSEVLVAPQTQLQSAEPNNADTCEVEKSQESILLLHSF